MVGDSEDSSEAILLRRAVEYLARTIGLWVLVAATYAAGHTLMDIVNYDFAASKNLDLLVAYWWWGVPGAWLTALVLVGLWHWEERRTSARKA